MKEVLLVSDKGGTGKSTLLGILKNKYSSEAIFADCSFSSQWPFDEKKANEEFFFLGNEPKVDENLCLYCGDCERVCEFLAINLSGEGIYLDRQKCTGCGHCYYICPAGAIQLKKIKAGKIYTIGDPEQGLIVCGVLQHYPKNGTRPVTIIRNKAIEIGKKFSKNWLILEAPSGWNIITLSLLHFCSILVIIIEPHRLVFSFLDKILESTKDFSIKVKLVISKSDINSIISTRIIQEYKQWEIICLPWSDNAENDNHTYFDNFIV